MSPSATGGGDGTIKLWSLEHGKLLRTLIAGYSRLDSGVVPVAIAPEGRLETGQLPHPFSGHGGPVNAVAIAPDLKRLVSGSEDKTINIRSG